MHPKIGPHIGLNDRLDHRAEDVSVDLVPLQASRFNQQAPGFAVEIWDIGVIAEQAAIDLREVSSNPLGPNAPFTTCILVGDIEGNKDVMDDALGV